MVHPLLRKILDLSLNQATIGYIIRVKGIAGEIQKSEMLIVTNACILIELKMTVPPLMLIQLIST